MKENNLHPQTTKYSLLSVSFGAVACTVTLASYALVFTGNFFNLASTVSKGVANYVFDPISKTSYRLSETVSQDSKNKSQNSIYASNIMSSTLAMLSHTATLATNTFTVASKATDFFGTTLKITAEKVVDPLAAKLCEASENSRKEEVSSQLKNTNVVSMQGLSPGLKLSASGA